MATASANAIAKIMLIWIAPAASGLRAIPCIAPLPRDANTQASSKRTDHGQTSTQIPETRDENLQQLLDPFN
jgi:hypothetical protein